MNRSLANALAYVFHPLLMATIIIVLLFFFTPSLVQPISDENIYPVLSAVFILTFLIPLLSIGILKITKSISDFQLKRREERFMPFLFVAVYYGLTTYLFAYKLRMSEVIVVIFATIAAIILIVAFLNLKIKISAHATGIWGVAGFLTALHFLFPGTQLLWPLVASYVVAGLVSSARLAVHAHTPSEVNYGALLGFVISFTAIVLFV